MQACDAHIHVLDARFPRIPDPAAPLPAKSTIDDYLRVRETFGTTRAVVVQAKNFGTDNRAMLDAVQRLGPDGRGVVVLTPLVSDDELRVLAAQGVRGVRFSVWNPDDAVVRIDMIPALARRIAELGWHIQVHLSGEQIVRHASMLASLPCHLVVDHMARLPPGQGTEHQAFSIVRRLIDAGRTWVKLSGPYLNTATPRPDYSDASRVARAFVAAAPERLVWGSDWPHVTERENPPDDRQLRRLLDEWVPRPEDRRRILVENPEILYGFA
ncbi:amidohydrolase [Saccharopolyspora sp. ASAGF58]|uniref:amidohydrolase family protein n=1 Tax=Saccharopolyspora sp. ASAGF58 TaxID=2719023 RepID=UPI00143FEECB|nr:amidohydrolase family protein [Saccharopolyspora sp. ASAGF58]QIZ37274.1 2-pyrone-4,6-dicarboxylate hydrolase [Saccharopolyspora sp. ASAGF58]